MPAFALLQLCCCRQRPCHLPCLLPSLPKKEACFMTTPFPPSTGRTAPVRLALAGLLVAALPWLTACQTTPAAPDTQAIATQLGAPVPVLAVDAKGLAIIAYYGAAGSDAEGDLRNSPQPGGFYRVYMGKNSSGQHLLQEFYQDSASAQSSAYPVDAAANLLDWEVTPQEGEVVFYRPNGQVRSLSVYRNGKLNGRTVYYNDDGSERASYTWVDDALDGPFVVREPGTQRSAEGLAQDDQLIRLQGRDAQGRALSAAQALELLADSFSKWHADLFQ